MILDVDLPFTPRNWQLPLLDDNSQQIIAVVHRRGGKSTALVWRGLRKAATWDRPHIPARQRSLKDNPPRIVHVLPKQVMWTRTGLWDKLTMAAKGFPGAVVHKTERRVVMPNGGVFQAGGMDEPDGWRGGYADEVTEDEADDVLAGGLDMVVEPMLTDFMGSRLKVGTPKGNGRLAEAYNAAADDPHVSRYLLPYTATDVFTPEQVAKLRRDLTEEEFAQEIECSFTSPNSGSYYAKWLDAAERDGRVCNVPYDPALPLFTSWDLGIDDSTAIWFFQISKSGEWRWLEYFEDSGAGLEHYVRELQRREYIYNRHFLPHDVEVRELTNGGKSRRQFLAGLGVRPIQVVPAANPADRIAAARAILPRSWFNANGTAIGRKKLRAYRREWNEAMGVWRANPVHDASSHAADAFGTGVQGAQDPSSQPKANKHVIGRHTPVSGSTAWMA